MNLKPAIVSIALLVLNAEIALAQSGTPPTKAATPSDQQKLSKSTRQAGKMANSAQALRALGNANAMQRRTGLLWLAEHGLHGQAIQLAPLLKDEDAVNRQLAEQTMWLMWSRTGDAKFDQKFSRAVSHLADGDFATAIDAFGVLIRAKPQLAEAWNKRATAYFLAGRLDESLADCDEVLKRNPVHFGALSGYGQIYTQRGEYEQALDYFNRALDVNPNMNAVQTNIRALQKLIDERRRNTT